jgi:hypothetical protein
MVRFKLVEVPCAGDTADIAGRILQLAVSGWHDHGRRCCLRRGMVTFAMVPSNFCCLDALPFQKVSESST